MPNTLPMTAAVASGHVELSARSWISLVPGWAQDAEVEMTTLRTELNWQQEILHLYGRRVAQPRLTAVCGRSMDPASGYRRRNPDQPWPPAAALVLDRVRAELRDWEPNGLIANLYRDGGDSISWHADDEPALGSNPTVVSVSYGATRRFRLKPRAGGAAIVLDLNNGDLLIMGGATQSEFLHAITKTKSAVAPRLSLTFRRYD